MKEMIMLFCGILIGRHLFAQTFSEWFRQNHTELKYLGEQIAALRGYDGVLRSGYGVAREGLGEIADIRDTDLSLNTEHFAELDEPSTVVREDDAIEEILEYCWALPIIAETIGDICRGMPAAPMHWPEMGTIAAGNISGMVKAYEGWLEDIETDAVLRMDDASRWRRLNGMRGELENVYRSSLLLLAELQESQKNRL